MTRTELTLPELALLAGTRGMLGAGLGLLLGQKLDPDKRQAVGWTLAAIGVLTTIPLAIIVFRGRKRASRLAREFFDAFIAKDRQAMERLLADDFVFTSPREGEDHIGKAAYFERAWLNASKLRDFRIEQIVDNGSEVVVRHSAVRKSDGVRFRNTELLRCEGGRIREVELYFGPELRTPSALHLTPS